MFVAPQNGRFRAVPGEKEAQPVGSSGKEVMGFSIVGPNRFLGSGHLGALENLLPNLGSTASNNAGKMFNPVSLLGKVAESSDRGRTFRPAGDVPGEPVAVTAAGGEFRVALADKRTLQSADAGAAYTVRTQI